MTAKFITAAEAAAMIKDNSTVGINGFISFCLADDILTEIENRYISEKHPRNISVVNVAGVGGDGKDRGMNHLAHEGLMKRLLCSNLSLANKVYPLIMNNAFPTFMIPQGVLANMMRAITSGKPGVITKVGMHTFVDPRVDGGRINMRERIICSTLLFLLMWLLSRAALPMLTETYHWKTRRFI